MIDEITKQISERLQYELDEWYTNKVLRKNGIQIDCMSGKEIDKLNEGITIEITTDNHGNDIYSAFRDGKIISQLLIKNIGMTH